MTALLFPQKSDTDVSSARRQGVRVRFPLGVADPRKREAAQREGYQQELARALDVARRIREGRATTAEEAFAAGYFLGGRDECKRVEPELEGLRALRDSIGRPAASTATAAETYRLVEHLKRERPDAPLDKVIYAEAARRLGISKRKVYEHLRDPDRRPPGRAWLMFLRNLCHATGQPIPPQVAAELNLPRHAGA